MCYVEKIQYFHPQYKPSYCVIPYLPISYREVEMQLLSKFLLLLRLLPWRITMGNAETLQNLSKKMQPSFAQPIPAPLKALFPSQPDSNQYLEKMCKIRSHKTAGDTKTFEYSIYIIGSYFDKHILSLCDTLQSFWRPWLDQRFCCWHGMILNQWTHCCWHREEDDLYPFIFIFHYGS